MLAWHFVSKSQRLGYGDDRLVRPGVTYKHHGSIELCESGLHASERLIDALSYARGPYLCRVRLGGKIIKGDDKVVTTSREVLWIANVGPQLREFARWCALQVIHLWEAPEVAREYLETGNQESRAAARAAAQVAQDAAESATSRAAASGAASDAAWVAAGAAVGAAARVEAMVAAMAAARAAARAAASAAATAAASDAAWATARDAAREKQNKKLEELITNMKRF